MNLILFLKLVRDDALRIGIGIEFHSLGAVYEYDLSSKEERGLGTANAPLTDDRSVQLWVSATGFSKSVIYWCVKLFMALYVNTAMYFNRFNIGSQLNYLNISVVRVLKTARNIIRAACFWSLDILSRFGEEVVPIPLIHNQLRAKYIFDKTFFEHQLKHILIIVLIKISLMKLRNINGLYGKTKKIYHQHVCLVVYGFDISKLKQLLIFMSL